MTDHPKNTPNAINYFADNPISTASEDLLQRSKFVERIVREIDMIDASQGYVLAVMGQWGSGKTSVLNLVKECLQNKEMLVVDYNPWLLSGTEALVAGLFGEINAQLKQRGKQYRSIATKMLHYSELVAPFAAIPVAGSWSAGLLAMASFAKKFRELRSVSVAAQKEQVTKALGSLDHPIVVIIDDIDRLDRAEIREIFKLVRLTASFPNVIYLLSFDRIRIENALADDGVPGRAYLEKIVQNGIELPIVPEKVLTREVVQALEAALEQVKAIRRDAEVWDKVILDIVVPAMKNMRDVRRLAMAVRSTTISLTDSVEISDIVALEVMRLFLPDVFWLIVVDQIPTGNIKVNMDKLRGIKAQAGSVGELLGNSFQEEAIIDAFLRITMPTSSYCDLIAFSGEMDVLADFLKKRRIAHSEIRKLYLEQVMPDRLTSFAHAERIYHLADDGTALKREFEAMSNEQLENIISELSRFAGEYSEVAIVNMIAAILNAMPRLPKNDNRSTLMPDARFAAISTVGRMLEQFRWEPAATKTAVDAIIPQLQSFSARLELILLIGHIPGAGRRLVSLWYAQQFQQQYEQDAAAMPIEHLVREDNPLRVLIAPVYWGSRIAQTIDTTAPLSVHYAVFRSAVGENNRQSFGSTHIQRTPVLAWGELCGVYSDESTIAQVYKRMCDDSEPDSSDLLKLIKKYLGGWRPENVIRMQSSAE